MRKADNGAGGELHNRASYGFAAHQGCKQDFTIAQVVDLQGVLPDQICSNLSDRQ